MSTPRDFSETSCGLFLLMCLYSSVNAAALNLVKEFPVVLPWLQSARNRLKLLKKLPTIG